MAEYKFLLICFTLSARKKFSLNKNQTNEVPNAIFFSTTNFANFSLFKSATTKFLQSSFWIFMIKYLELNEQNT